MDFSWDSAPQETLVPPDVTALPTGEDPQGSTDAAPTNQLGRYTVEGQLGAGGMGSVYQVRDPILRRSVAMKVIHPELMKRPQWEARFVEEAQIGAQLQHPNIVPVYELGQLDDGSHYFTMKKVEGRPFTEQIQAVHAASDSEQWREAETGETFKGLLQTFCEVAQAIAYAHTQGVIHRDLKPDNVLIGAFGEVLVVDWGIAKVLGTAALPLGEVDTLRQENHHLQTRMGSVTGTPNYMAPEQARGQIDALGPHTDVYALGAILYEILDGNPPFVGHSAAEILAQVTTGRSASLRLFHAVADPSAPQPLQQGKRPDALIVICEQAMHPQPEQRHDRVEALIEDIQQWLRGEERHDRAMQEMAVAAQIQHRAVEQGHRARQLWEQVDRRVTDFGVLDDKVWALWQEAETIEENMRTAQQHHRRQLQAALVHAPALPSAHHALAQRCVQLIVVAQNQGEVAVVERERKRLQVHLQHLSVEQQREVQETLAQAQTNRIIQQRLASGPLLGQEQLVEAVDAAIADGGRCVVLRGPAGVGKTRLALEVAQHSLDVGKRVVYVSLGRLQQGDNALYAFAKALDVALQHRSAAAHLAAVLRVKPTLLVVDRPEQVAADVVELLTQWLDDVEDLQVLVTSRHPMPLPDVQKVHVKPLSLLMAMRLFARRGRQASPLFSLHKDNRGTVSRLVEHVGRLPQAIELLSAKLHSVDLDTLLNQMEQQSAIHDSRASTQGALHMALDWSWQMLSAELQQTLSHISLFRGGFSLHAAQVVVNQASTETSLSAQLDILTDHSLLQREVLPGGGMRYSMLASVQAHAAAQLRRTGDLLDAQSRHASFYADFGERQGGVFSAELLRERDNLLAGVYWGDAQTAPQCALALLCIVKRSGPATMGIAVVDHLLQQTGISAELGLQLDLERVRLFCVVGQVALAKSALTRLGAILAQLDEQQGSTQLMMGQWYLESGHVANMEGYAAAAMVHFQQAKQTLLLASDDRCMAEAFNALGNRHRARGEMEKALKCFTTARQHARRCDDAHEEGRSIGNMGNLDYDRGNLTAAKQQYIRAIALLQQGGARNQEASFWGNLGAVERDLGNTGVARQHFQRAISLVRHTEDRSREAYQHGMLGILERDEGNLEIARDMFSEALRIMQDVGNRAYEGSYLGFLGGIDFDQGYIDRAQSHYMQSLQIARETDNRSAEATLLGNMALVFQARRDWKQAESWLVRARDAANEIQDITNAMVQGGNLGELFVHTGDWANAEACLRQSIAHCDQVFPVASGAFRGSLANLFALRGRHAEAAELLAVGEPQVRQHHLEWAKFLAYKARCLHRAGDQKAARGCLQAASEICTQQQHTPQSECARRIATVADELSSG